MPLPPNASITDVINKLTELEGINQKTELASVIGSPALSTDTVAQQIVKMQTAKDAISTAINNKGQSTTNIQSLASYATAIQNISTGKAFASGTTTATSNTFSFTSANGNTFNANKVEVSGLSFLPTVIIIFNVSTSINSATNQTFYTNDNLNTGTSLANIIMSQSSPAPNAGSSVVVRRVGQAYVNVGSFSLPVVNASSIYQWFAYE